MSDSGVVGIVQARMGSTRLPGKVLLPLCGKPMLSHIVERVGRTPGIQKVVVATSREDGDEPIAQWVQSQSDIGLFRGSENDCLERFWEAACKFEASVVVRITGDCPLIDSKVIQSCLELLDEETAFVSTGQQRTFPVGLDVEIVRMEALEAAHQRAKHPEEREHVMPFIWSRPEDFSQRRLRAETDFSNQRWTVDTPEDFELVTRIFSALFPEKPDFGYQEVLKLLDENPEWRALNSHIKQKGAQL